MKNINKFNKYVYILIFSILSLSVFILKIDPLSSIYFKSDSALINFIYEIDFAVCKFDIVYVVLWIFIIYFYSKVYFDNKKDYKYKLLCIILSTVFSIISVIGKCYSMEDSMYILYCSSGQIFKTVVYLLGYYIIYYAILKKILNVSLDNLKSKKKNKLIDLINKHPFLISFIFIIIMWLPYIIISFPGLSIGDTFDELCQYFHIETWSVKSINLISENMYINRHHSVLHTVIIGFIYSLGKSLVSFTLGAGIYLVLQVCLLIVIFSFMIKYMCKIKINNYIILYSLLFIGLSPIVCTYAISHIKDTPNAIFNLLYVIFLLQIIRNFDSIFKKKIRIVLFIFTIMMVLFLRNNGIFTFLFSFPLLFFVYKDRWKKILLVFSISLLLYGTYDKIILNSFDISKGSIREVLSIPVMQMARVVHNKSEVFSEKDIEKIDKVFSFEWIGKSYDPDIADDAKNTYKKDSSKEDLYGFFDVWFKYLKKEPLMYIESVINSTYGYFYPGKNRDILYLYAFKSARAPYFDVKNIEAFTNVKVFLNRVISIYYSVPFFMNNVAYFDWVLLFSCIHVIIKKKWKYFVPLMALVMVLLSCLASPLNGSFRYVLPIVFSFPILLAINYLVYKDKYN